MKIKKIILRLLKKALLMTLFFKKVNNKSIVFYSDPDLSDNSLAIFLYLHGENSRDFLYYWVVSDIFKAKKMLFEKYGELNNVFFLRKNGVTTWIKTRFMRYQFDTHGAPYEKPFFSERTSICLWHGSPLKLIGNSINADTFVGGQDWTVCAHEIFSQAIMEGLGVNSSNIIISGYPRNDFLLEKDKKSDSKKYIVWMPTYAKSVGSPAGGGYKGVDSSTQDNSLGALSFEDLTELNIFCGEVDMQLVIKLHPYDVRNNIKYVSYSHIKIITNQHSENFGLYTYELLSKASALVSDCSSVVFDFMLTGRPIAIDIESLKNYSRPLLFNIFSDEGDFFKISSIKDLKKFIADVHDDNIKANYYMNKYNKDVNFDFSKKIVKKLSIL